MIARPTGRDVLHLTLAALCLLTGLASWVPGLPELLRVALAVLSLLMAAGVLTVLWVWPALVRRRQRRRWQR